MKKISDDILAILSGGTYDGNLYKLPEGRLERPVYAEANKVLEASGGKWNRYRKGHVFDGDAEDAIDLVILTGEYANPKQDLGQFDTPAEVAAMAAGYLNLRTLRGTLLEPSAGLGNLVEAAVRSGVPEGKIYGYEVDKKRHLACCGRFPLAVIERGDFLSVQPAPMFGCCLMNPPFQKKLDILHVVHAMKFLQPGGELVAIMGAGVAFRQDAATVRFRDSIRSNFGMIEALPPESFKISGTSVNTVLVQMTAPS